MNVVTKQMPVNARNGFVAQDILRTELKRQLSAAGFLRSLGFVQYELGDAVREGDAPRLFEKVLCEETVRDRTILHTYVVTVHLYGEEERP